MTNEIIKNQILKIVNDYPITSVVLFGSRASGTNSDDSDVDLIIEFSEPITLFTLAKIKLQLEEMLGLEVDVIHGPIRETDMIEVDKVVELYAA
ncbi:MAG: nucleotidyltransferase domain-containing protein [Acetatifactor sp.]|nr:nucleotidyltransferase domain-containing protein [Acetatifactor sp.]